MRAGDHAKDGMARSRVIGVQQGEGRIDGPAAVARCPGRAWLTGAGPRISPVESGKTSELAG